MEKTFDQNLLELNLKLSPSERLIQHQKALDLLLEIDKAKETIDEKPQ